MFTEYDLSALALKLDEDERRLMASQGDTPEFRAFAAESSGNVALDGNVRAFLSALEQHTADHSLLSSPSKSWKRRSKYMALAACH